MHLVSFLEVNAQTGDISLGCKNYKYFGGIPDITDILGVNSRCLVQDYV